MKYERTLLWIIATEYLRSCDYLLLIHLKTHYIRSSTCCFLSQAAVCLVSAIPSNFSENICKISKILESLRRAYGDLRKLWEIFLKKITEVSTKILICAGVKFFYWYDMKTALIFSNNVYWQLLNSTQEVLPFFYRSLNPGKHMRKVQEGKLEVSLYQANVDITGYQPWVKQPAVFTVLDPMHALISWNCYMY